MKSTDPDVHMLRCVKFWEITELYSSTPPVCTVAASLTRIASGLPSAAAFELSRRVEHSTNQAGGTSSGRMPWGKMDNPIGPGSFHPPRSCIAWGDIPCAPQFQPHLLQWPEIFNVLFCIHSHSGVHNDEADSRKRILLVGGLAVPGQLHRPLQQRAKHSMCEQLFNFVAGKATLGSGWVEQSDHGLCTLEPESAPCRAVRNLDAAADNFSVFELPQAKNQVHYHGAAP
ncbi:hypothetical protein FB451DRAFT_1172617 [Mycena latifolia]|nr:hypothetical protein FB451DRAFT_1172617 [Mycena latifolia]